MVFLGIKYVCIYLIGIKTINETFNDFLILQ